MRVYHLAEEMERDEALERAWRWLDERRSQHRLLIVPVRKSTEYSPVLLNIASRVQTQTARTLRTIAHEVRGAAVLVVWPSKETLEELQEWGPADVLVVPWRVEESDAWLHAHSPTPVLGGPTLDEPTIGDAVVLQAMRGLTNFVNPNNNLVTYDDRDEAIRVLRVLIRYGRRVNPDELYRWALANGWTGKGATNLQTLATEVLAGKRHRLHSASPPLGRDIITYWEEKARQSPPPS